MTIETFDVGIVKHSLMVTCVTAAANLRLLRKWAGRVGDHTGRVRAGRVRAGRVTLYVSLTHRAARLVVLRRP